jgi:hypothetical protein
MVTDPSDRVNWSHVAKKLPLDDEKIQQSGLTFFSLYNKSIRDESKIQISLVRPKQLTENTLTARWQYAVD